MNRRGEQRPALYNIKTKMMKLALIAKPKAIALRNLIYKTVCNLRKSLLRKSQKKPSELSKKTFCI